MNILRNHAKQGFRSQNYETTTAADSDEKISKAVLEQTFQFLAKTTSDVSSRSRYHTLSKLSNIEECSRVGLHLIETHTKILVVDDTINLDAKTGLALATWERTLNVTGPSTCMWMSENEMEKLQTEGRVVVYILTVAKSAFHELKRYTSEHKRPRTSPRPISSYRGNRFHMRVPPPIPLRPTSSQQIIRNKIARHPPRSQYQLTSHQTQLTPTCGCQLY